MLSLFLLGSCAAASIPEDVECDPMVYQSVDPEDEDIWLLTGSQRVALTGPDTRDFNPEWSPTGDRIAFTTGVGSDLDVAVMSADGSGRRVVWDGGSRLWASAVDWSPDAGFLVFDAWGPEAPLQVFTVDVEGGEAVALTRSSSSNGKPAWSPDGARLYYLSVPADGAMQDVFSMSPDGSDVVNLTRNPDHLDVLAEPSPDGSVVAFRSDRTGDAEIWLMDGEGGDLRQLTQLPGIDSNPTWSSDGRHIVFTHQDGDRPPEVWVMAADGSDPRRILRGGSVPDCP